MFIPLGTDRPLRRPTLVNYLLVGVNVGIFLALEVVARFSPESADRVHDLLCFDSRHFHWWGLVTYAFLHGGWMHILGNMVFLWSFGPNVEDRFGRVGYLAFYLFAAAVAAGAHALFEPDPVIGASGSIAAVTGAYLVLFPHTVIRVFVWFFYIGVFGIPAWVFITGQIAYNFWMQSVGSEGVAVMAHLGGYAFGMALAMSLLATRVLAREPYDLFTISRQAVRRRQFRELRFQRDRDVSGGRAPTFGRAAALDPAVSEAVAGARAEVSTRLAAGDSAAAAAAYRRLLSENGHVPGAALLNRKSQYDLANYLFQSGDHVNAAAAYELFLKGYPADREVPAVRLMLGLVSARYLNDPMKAKAEISAALPALGTDEQKTLARELLAELG